MMWAWLAVWSLTSMAAVWVGWRAAFGAAAPRRARRTLDMRLARGEIDVDEHRRRIEELAASHGGGSHAPAAGIALAVGVLVAMLLLLVGASVAWAVTASAWDGWDVFGMRAHHQSMHGGRDTSSAPEIAGTSAQAIDIAAFAFDPGNVRVPLGATVTWTNADDVPHDATAADGSWKTPILKTGESASVTLDRAGEYPYKCSIHPSMQARILVQ